MIFYLVSLFWRLFMRHEEGASDRLLQDALSLHSSGMGPSLIELSEKSVFPGLVPAAPAAELNLVVLESCWESRLHGLFDVGDLFVIGLRMFWIGWRKRMPTVPPQKQILINLGNENS
ncbi:hypothetical protein QLQ86_10285 [Halomonas sp. LR5S13]|uniref:hypothetical protein n=1 Tax=Halomonas rhizosphaerae TaxID=3043296 RepID=UPI0024A84D89|nr:hypothetical protein [Halomonas rhizosphaerae]MDI5921171.1 hypothetical protein [Halomonas rhizosphaerae]